MKDVVQVMMLLMDSTITAERFVLSAENWPYRRLFTTMAEALGKKPPHIAAKPWMAEMVWRMAKVKGWITGKRPLITRETARTAQLKVFYDAARIQEALPGFRFRPLEDTLREISAAYLAHRQHN